MCNADKEGLTHTTPLLIDSPRSSVHYNFMLVNKHFHISAFSSGLIALRFVMTRQEGMKEMDGLRQ